MNWERVCEQAQTERKYYLGESELDVYLISLRRTPWRKLRTVRSLQLQNISFKVFDAVDGLLELEHDVVSSYAGRKKRSRLSRTEGMDREELKQLQIQYIKGELRDENVRSSLHARLQFGCYMSHVKLWLQMLRRESRLFVILEDDVLLERDFVPRLVSLLRQLPSTWGVLYLNGSYKKYGPRYSEGLVISRGGVGAFGYVISSKAASHLLQDAVFRSNKAIDHVIDGEVLSGRILAFHAIPPLVQLVPELRSTLAY
jgi:GR25 family glycosyltransferase involved in LPS biosynthesis